MSHIASRPTQRPAHRRTPSNSQTPDKRFELVGKLESCIGEVLEATKAYKSPQQQSAHHNANQMFQQRVMASRGQMGNISDQDWLGTMMQCLNESMRTQQSSFVRNTTLDVALKTFASSVFEALGPVYFQESFDKCRSLSKPSVSNNANSAYSATGKYGVPSPPREMTSNQSLTQSSNLHHPPAPVHAVSFPSAHQQLVQRPSHSVSPGVVPLPHHEIHGMPILQRPLPPARQPGRPPKRQSPVEAPNPPPRKRTYTCEALRQAAGPMGPPPTPTQTRPSLSNPHKHRLCIDFWDVQQERDVQRKQAILGYGGKWYVFQCHRHEDVLFFKTAEGARHHMTTRHTLQSQHIDFLDIVQELGVEVMNCDVARAEKNNLEAVNMWNRVDSNSGQQQGGGIRREASVPVPVPIRTHIPTTTRSKSASEYPLAMDSEQAPPSSARLDSPSRILLSDGEASEDTTADWVDVAIKKEPMEKELDSFATPASPGASTSTSTGVTQSTQPAPWETRGFQARQKVPIPVTEAGSNILTIINISQSPEREKTTAPIEEDLAIGCDLTASTTRATETPDCPEQIPALTPDSPEASELSEPPSLEELDSFEIQRIENKDPKVVDDDREEGGIGEPCIRVASCSPVLSGKTLASPESSKKQKRRIGAAGSAPLSPSEQRKRLPGTPESSQKKRKERQSFRSPAQETGPSAHDQFKTKACKKCSERFYFRAQLATHMMSEHPEVIVVE